MKKNPLEKQQKLNKLNKQIIKEETEINEELFMTYFNFQRPTKMLKYLHDLNHRNKNYKLVNLIKSRLSDLKNAMKKMSEDEIKNEKLYEVVHIVGKILKFNE